MASQRGRNAFEMFFFLILLVGIVGAGVWFIGGPEIPAEPIEPVEEVALEESIEKAEAVEAKTEDESTTIEISDGISVEAEGGLLGNLAERIRNRNSEESTEESDEE